MPRHRVAQNVPIKSWLSAKLDSREGRFIQVGNSLLLSKEYQNLSGVAKNLYLCMAMECGGKNAYTFSAGAAKKYGISKSSFERAKKELQVKKFIQLLLDEERSQFKACTFRFINGWKEKAAPHFGTGKGSN